MAMSLSQIYRFDASHTLPDWPQVHGHSYEVKVFVAETEPDADYVIAMKDFNDAVTPVIAELNNSYLNDIIPVPTMENIARWIALRLAAISPQKIIVYRPTLGMECIYEPYR
ncbi:MAG: hypothetical protein CMH30_06325 [Micavibrio sp.]|nr:hypothetical protein [Micavibrio sp.]|tara:strand:- start:318 stop:653 length:336 start_codon:yes stop_codon:yes gene_type:complete